MGLGTDEVDSYSETAAEKFIRTDGCAGLYPDADKKARIIRNNVIENRIKISQIIFGKTVRIIRRVPWNMGIRPPQLHHPVVSGGNCHHLPGTAPAFAVLLLSIRR